jgi:NADPH2:quinone reductase
MNDVEDYRGAADAVLAALVSGALEGAGTAYRLRDVAQAHADLEAGRTCGALYLKP